MPRKWMFLLNWWGGEASDSSYRSSGIESAFHSLSSRRAVPISLITTFWEIVPQESANVQKVIRKRSGRKRTSEKNAMARKKRRRKAFHTKRFKGMTHFLLLCITILDILSHLLLSAFRSQTELLTWIRHPHIRDCHAADQWDHRVFCNLGKRFGEVDEKSDAASAADTSDQRNPVCRRMNSAAQQKVIAWRWKKKTTRSRHAVLEQRTRNIVNSEDE